MSSACRKPAGMLLAGVLAAATPHAWPEPVDLERSGATLDVAPEDPGDAQAKATERWALEQQRQQHLDAHAEQDEQALAARATSRPDGDWLQDAIARRAAEEQWARQRGEMENANRALNHFLDEQDRPEQVRSAGEDRGGTGRTLRTLFLAMVLAAVLTFGLYLLVRPRRHHRRHPARSTARGRRRGHGSSHRRRQPQHGEGASTSATSPTPMADVEPRRGRHRHRRRRRSDSAPSTALPRSTVGTKP